MSVDPVVTDLATGKSFGRYHYAENSPYKYKDLDGRDSYLVSRPLNNIVLGAVASHNFVVSNAHYPGDPKATVHSYGNNGNGVTGKVTEKTEGMSAGTLKADTSFWKGLSSHPASVDLNTTKINASDAAVDKAANGVQENTKYSLNPSSSPSSNETNSNSAASAVANAAQGSSVEVPGGARLSPGADKADRVKISNEDKK